jgi:hypothetical protein
MEALRRLRICNSGGARKQPARVKENHLKKLKISTPDGKSKGKPQQVQNQRLEKGCGSQPETESRGNPPKTGLGRNPWPLFFPGSPHPPFFRKSR